MGVPRISAIFAGFCLSVSLGCSPETSTSPAAQPELRTATDKWGLITCSEATSDKTCFTHRTVIGVSMGASGAGQIGLSRPELFDTIGMLGIPLLDWSYMLRNFERYYLGGFCERDTILANMATLSDPDGPGFCGKVPGEVLLEPSGAIVEADQDFNHWYRWIKEGRGGNFGRNKLRESFQDISLAFGNALYHNPDSPYFPPGVPLDYRTRTDPDRCLNPTPIKGLKHKEFNPDGTYDVIPVCETRTNEGVFLPGDAGLVGFEMLIAVDYNGNGRRDWAEPVMTMAHERYDDVGAGPNDVFDWMRNPAGKAKNARWDEGEAYEDTGLDGVPGTGDYGEGNGKFDYSPNTQNYFDLNPRMLVETLPEGHMSRMNLYADAGIRDFLMSAAGTNWFWSSLKQREGEKARDYDSFFSLVDFARTYDFLSVDMSPDEIGKHMYVRYGRVDAKERDINRGDGHHVGSADQVLNRFLTSLHFVQSRFHEPDRRKVLDVGDVTQLIQPGTYYSTALDETRPYGIVFPPGYHDPKNSEQRYPVVDFLHGQGQESDDLLASAILFFGYMADSYVEDTMRRFESDWAKFIIVFPDSRCRRGECDGGNFNANHPGVAGDGPRFMDAMFELMAEVEGKYRVAIPVEVPL